MGSSSMRVRFGFVALGAAAALGALAIAPGAGRAGYTSLSARVGPGFTIQVRASDGSLISSLAPGTYAIEVSDQSSEHNFHLTGADVDMRTGVDDIGTTTWNVTLSSGTYRFVCDVHSYNMRGSFSVKTPGAATRALRVSAVSVETSRRALLVRLRSSRSASAQLTVSRGSKRVASARLPVRTGLNRLRVRLPRHRSGYYLLTIRIRAGAQVRTLKRSVTLR